MDAGMGETRASGALEILWLLALPGQPIAADTLSLNACQYFTASQTWNITPSRGMYVCTNTYTERYTCNICEMHLS